MRRHDGSQRRGRTCSSLAAFAVALLASDVARADALDGLGVFLQLLALDAAVALTGAAMLILVLVRPTVIIRRVTMGVGVLNVLLGGLGTTSLSDARGLAGLATLFLLQGLVGLGALFAALTRQRRGAGEAARDLGERERGLDPRWLAGWIIAWTALATFSALMPFDWQNLLARAVHAVLAAALGWFLLRPLAVSWIWIPSNALAQILVMWLVPASWGSWALVIASVVASGAQVPFLWNRVRWPVVWPALEVAGSWAATMILTQIMISSDSVPLAMHSALGASLSATVTGCGLQWMRRAWVRRAVLAPGPG